MIDKIIQKEKKVDYYMDIYMSFIQPFLLFGTILILGWIVFNILIKSKLPPEGLYKYFAASLIIQFFAIIFFEASGLFLFVITVSIILFHTEEFDEKLLRRSARD